MQKRACLLTEQRAIGSKGRPWRSCKSMLPLQLQWGMEFIICTVHVLIAISLTLEHFSLCSCHLPASIPELRKTIMDMEARQKILCMTMYLFLVPVWYGYLISIRHIYDLCALPHQLGGESSSLRCFGLSSSRTHLNMNLKKLLTFGHWMFCLLWLVLPQALGSLYYWVAG